MLQFPGEESLTSFSRSLVKSSLHSGRSFVKILCNFLFHLLVGFKIYFSLLLSGEKKKLFVWV